jgi:DNA invertase Pin-like site-specific DNA recombinase
MALIGYARVSSSGQSLDVQREKLIAAGVDPENHLFEEKLSGLQSNRPQLREAIRYARNGDTFLVSRLDRLARSASDLYRIVDELKAKGVGFKCIDQSEVDTTTNNGKLLFGILTAIAEFETGLRAERQMEGIAKAKANGVQFGRKAKATDDVTNSIRLMRQQGLLIRQIMENTGLSKASIYRALAE